MNLFDFHVMHTKCPTIKGFQKPEMTVTVVNYFIIKLQISLKLGLSSAFSPRFKKKKKKDSLYHNKGTVL